MCCVQVWVDSLNPEYLENALADVVHDVMGALWGLLKPSHPMRGHAMAAMQLLGKLGEGQPHSTVHMPHLGKCTVRHCCHAYGVGSSTRPLL